MFDTTENDGGFLQNFAMVIPKGEMRQPEKKKVRLWKLVLCYTMGHRWGSAGISWSGPGFPQKCKQCGKNKWFMKPNLRMRFTKWLDNTLTYLWYPLCKINIHRWKSHYGYSSFTIGGGASTKGTCYKCPSCKKTKNVETKS